ncbi:hypothetical protein ACFXTO_009688 [Malus domestica]
MHHLNLISMRRRVILVEEIKVTSRLSSREQWSEVEKALLANEDNLQDVPITEDDNIWDYLDGIAKMESDAIKARRT